VRVEQSLIAIHRVYGELWLSFWGPGGISHRLATKADYKAATIVWTGFDTVIGGKR